MLKTNHYFNLITWILGLLIISSLIGMISRPSLDPWYIELSRSQLTPPNFIFGLIWPFLYALIAIAGWIIWSTPLSKKIKILFSFQLIINWLWSPIFFYFHLTGVSLIFILTIIISVILIMNECIHHHKSIVWLLLPYLLWSSFACYLNGYIFLNNF
jgi:translocator protein